MILNIKDIQGFEEKNYDLIAKSLKSALNKDKSKAKTVEVKEGDIGRVFSVKDGIVRIKGLSNVVSNEKIMFSSGLQGLALNLEMHSVGALILGSERYINAKDYVFRTGEVLKIPVVEVYWVV